MNQVNQNSQLNQLSLEARLAREKQLADQLGPLRQQLETVRRTGPINGISADNIEVLITRHEEHIGALRESIDKDIKPVQLTAIPDLKTKVDDYLARHGRVYNSPEPIRETGMESMSAREVSQIRLMQNAITTPIFDKGKIVLDYWYKDDNGESYIQRTEDMKQGLFNLMSIREQDLV